MFKIAKWIFLGRSKRAYYIYLISKYFYDHKFKLLSNFFWRLNIILHGTEISPLAKIGKRLHIAHSVGIVIGAGVIIENDVKIFQNVTIGAKINKIGEYEYPHIEDGVTIYPGAVIIGEIKVGKNAIVGPNSVVIKSVSKNTIVSGVPAKLIGIELHE